jgi:hypothetical protein
MRATTLAVLCLAPLARLLAQDTLHYRFDEGCGSEVINLATGSAVGNASLVTTLPGGVAAARITGQFGAAMSGSVFPAGGGNTYLNTGWAPSTPTGSFSFAMWIRNRPGNPTAIAFGYLFGATGGNLRLFTGSSGKMFLSGFPGSATSVTNLTTLLNSGWVHVACTVDATTSQASWYVNGAPDGVSTFTGVVSIPGTNFTVGARNNTGGSVSPLDTDEFVLTTNVWTAAEVAAMIAAPRAGDGDYLSGIAGQCGSGNVVLGSTGGAPQLGNLGYSLTVSATTPSLYVLLAGFDRCIYGGVLPLPLDATPLVPLLNGCWILADAPITIGGTVVGTDVLPLPIGLGVPAGANVYTQALALDLATLGSSMSSGFATSPGL